MAIQSLTTRMSNQQDRIQQGVQSGQLTPREAVRLEKGAVRLDAHIAKDAFDGGGLTRRERAGDQLRLDGMSARIFAQKHDGQSVEK
ncbi:MAG TPA: hypothetical protein VND93_00545 [Myxococcales bacterium]|nr:hypothetical protein [Myxococcales bacterium]